RVGIDVFRALEHHVLEEVRKAGAPFLLVFRANVVPDRHVHDRRRMVLRENHPQPIWQGQDLILQFGRSDGGLDLHERTRDHRAGCEPEEHAAHIVNSIMARAGHRRSRTSVSVKSTKSLRISRSVSPRTRTRSPLNALTLVLFVLYVVKTESWQSWPTAALAQRLRSLNPAVTH